MSSRLGLYSKVGMSSSKFNCKRHKEEYSGTSIFADTLKLGTAENVPISEVSSFQGVYKSIKLGPEIVCYELKSCPYFMGVL